MTGYRVCLDCDRKIPAIGDAEHNVCADYLGGPEYLVGCEGYVHKELENAIIDEVSDPRWLKSHDKIIDEWVESRAAEKIVEEFTYKLDDWVREWLPYPFDIADRDENEADEAGQELVDYAVAKLIKAHLAGYITELEKVETA